MYNQFCTEELKRHYVEDLPYLYRQTATLAMPTLTVQRTGAHHDKNIQYAVFFSRQLDWVLLFCQLVHFTGWQVNVVKVASWWNLSEGIGAIFTQWLDHKIKATFSSKMRSFYRCSYTFPKYFSYLAQILNNAVGG